MTMHTACARWSKIEGPIAGAQGSMERRHAGCGNVKMTRWQHLHYIASAMSEDAFAYGSGRHRGKRREERLPTVLVVDDDRAIRETLQFLLEDSGYDVSDAPDGLVALRRLHEDPGPVVMLLDLMMPRLDGVGVLRAVADDPRVARRCAFIVITAGTQTVPLELQQLLSRLNVPDIPVVRKPFDIDELLAIIERMVMRLRVIRSRATNPLPSLDDEPAEASG